MPGRQRERTGGRSWGLGGEWRAGRGWCRRRRSDRCGGHRRPVWGAGEPGGDSGAAGSAGAGTPNADVCVDMSPAPSGSNGCATATGPLSPCGSQCGTACVLWVHRRCERRPRVEAGACVSGPSTVAGARAYCCPALSCFTTGACQVLPGALWSCPSGDARAGHELSAATQSPRHVVLRIDGAAVLFWSPWSSWATFCTAPIGGTETRGGFQLAPRSPWPP